ncbi:MAG: hypothetical protein EOP11_12220 [Proteobacteria bacterium]|nr:MAG: hypothetical protein EOP11_12220 [Pseudomonadota bacterium]
MKKLALALISFSLLSCGTTPKNEVARGIPQPQQAESVETFRRRCAFDDGFLNSPTSPTLCRIPHKNGTAFLPRESDLTADKEFDFGEQLPGFQISGNYVGSGNPPELVVERAIEARGNMDMKVIPRGGKTILRAYAGNYDSFSFTLYRCYGVGNTYESCEGFNP